ncbi:hypothetical protein JJV70_10170 [Streptomyces sp. JJ66]|nr:hypothetical protein [Streptomyces sp. JJ66]MBW1602469.1 hypothetical protein [Streptomyces sp. JJ66]
MQGFGRSYAPRIPRIADALDAAVVSLCDYSLGTRVAQALDGTLVTYDGN